MTNFNIIDYDCKCWYCGFKLDIYNLRYLEDRLLMLCKNHGNINHILYIADKTGDHSVELFRVEIEVSDNFSVNMFRDSSFKRKLWYFNTLKGTYDIKDLPIEYSYLTPEELGVKIKRLMVFI